MRYHPQIKWSEIARRAMWEYARKLELTDRLTSESWLSERYVGVRQKGQGWNSARLILWQQHCFSTLSQFLSCGPKFGCLQGSLLLCGHLILFHSLNHSECLVHNDQKDRSCCRERATSSSVPFAVK